MDPLSTPLHAIKCIVGNGQSGDLIWLLIHGIAQAYISVTGVLCCPSVCTLLFAQQQNTVLHSITQVVCKSALLSIRLYFLYFYQSVSVPPEETTHQSSHPSPIGDIQHLSGVIGIYVELL